MAKEQKKPTCGIIMPIGAMPPTYDSAHWSDVRSIINSAAEKAGFYPQIVSDSFEDDVIQSRIIKNLYENEVVVCDVSGVNPNVMFELGMRITFNKPVIAITDDFDDLPFDTKIIEHIKYPRDLHIHQTNKFIDDLASKIKLLHGKHKEGKYKTPLDSLGPFEVFTPSTQQVPAEKYIADGIDNILKRMAQLERDVRRNKEVGHIWPAALAKEKNSLTLTLRSKDEFEEHHIDELIKQVDGIRSVTFAGNSVTIQVERDGMSTVELLRLVPDTLGDLHLTSIEVD